jgi:hypothetical protein
MLTQVICLRAYTARMEALKGGAKPNYADELKAKTKWVEEYANKPINQPDGSRARNFISYYGQQVMTNKQRRDVSDGMIGAQAAVGKKIQKKLPADVVQWMLDNGAHAAHLGAIHPTRAWRFKKKDAENVQAANVLSICEEIPVKANKPHVASRLLCRMASTGNLKKMATSLLNQIEVMRGELIDTAQKTYDNWNTGSKGGPGLCQKMMFELSQVISEGTGDVICEQRSLPGVDHTFVAVFSRDESYSVDIPYSRYEYKRQGNWFKKDHVVFTEDDLIIKSVPNEWDVLAQDDEDREF